MCFAMHLNIPLLITFCLVTPWMSNLLILYLAAVQINAITFRQSAGSVDSEHLDLTVITLYSL